MQHAKQEVLSQDLKERVHLEGLDIDESVILELKMDLKKGE